MAATKPTRHETNGQQTSTPARTERLRVSWPHALLAVWGMAVSWYAFQVHRIIKAGGDAGCGFSDSLNCDKVIGSRFGEFFGIPLGIYGLAYFLVVLLTAINTQRDANPRAESGLRLLVSGAGMLGVLGLATISYIVLRAACPVCMTTHATILALFLVSWWQYQKARDKGRTK